MAVQASAAAPNPSVGSVATPSRRVRSIARSTPIGRASSADSTRIPTRALPGVTPKRPTIIEVISPTISTVPAIAATPAQRRPGSMSSV
jgi:hypothetical protein